MRIARVLGPALLLAAGVIAMLIALAIGGGADPTALADPGPVVRFGLPAASLMVNLGAAGVIGSLVLALFALSPSHPAFGKVLDVAAASAAVLAVAGAASAVFSFLSVSLTPFSFNDQFGEQLGFFVTQVALGQSWLYLTLAAALLTALCFAVRNQTALFFVLVLSAALLYPIAEQGHSAGAGSHGVATVALVLHMIFAAAWLGGLIAIVILRRSLNDSLPAVMARYSTVALVCFVVVAVSGYVSASIRLGGWEALSTPYGILVIGKVLALLALGAFGAVQRRFLLRRMTAGKERASFTWFVLGELVFMGIASGLAAALARTATPVSQETPLNESAAEFLTGAPLPAEFTFGAVFTTWSIDVLWLLVCGFGIFFYLAGARRLRKRGDAWPVHRSILWVAGMVLLAFITNGGLNAYQPYLFSVHMFGHMMLGMMVPLLLVPGAPITLALRAITKRKDGSRGAREWIMLVVHSRIAGFLTNPIVAAILFVGSMIVFYYTPLFDWSMRDHLGHEWMVIHFVIVGFLFIETLIGTDPIPYRMPYPFRLLMLLGVMAFHAFFGVAIMSGTGLMLADWFGAMGRTWGLTPLEDQQVGGSIAWGVGELPTIILAIAVAIQWNRSDNRETKRLDRNADRTGDAELNEYNAMLERLNKRP